MIAQLAEQLRRGEVSAAALVDRALQREAQERTRLNAVWTVFPNAGERAKELDSELARGIDRGPLHGIPVAVKANIHVKGMKTSCGSPLFANEPAASESAECVQLLEEAGAVVMCATGMHELAYGITSDNPHFGSVRNPRDESRIPGGSSGGSGAAVAAGILPMALGTDTGGSVRIPASFCGCVGLKPTYDLVSTKGVVPLGLSLDTVGPFGSSVDDVAIAMNAISRRREDYRPGAVADLRGLRIGRPDNFYFDRVAPDVASRIDDAFRRAADLGAEIVRLKLPDIAEWNATARVILLAEAAAVFERHMSQPRSHFGDDVWWLLQQGRVLPATMYIQAQRLRSTIVRTAREIWNHVDCLFTPTTPTTAPKIGAKEIEIGGSKEDVRLATTRLVRGLNLLGWPALSLPCGNDGAGLPVGLQIVGPPFEEKRIIKVAAALEHG